MAGAGRGGAGGRSCPVPPRRSRSSAAPQPHLPRGRSAQPAVRARRRRPTRYGGAGGRGELGGAAGGSRRWEPAAPPSLPGVSVRHRGGRSALGGSRAERPPGMGVLGVWGNPGYSSCAGGARVSTLPGGASGAGLLGASPAPRRRQPRGIAILGVPQTLGTSVPGLCRPGAAPSLIPGLFPSPRYPHPRVIVIARVTSPRDIPDCGVSPSPGYPKARVTPDSGGASLGFLFPLFPEYFRPPGTPIPGLFPVLAGYSYPQGTPIPVPSCPARVPAELLSLKMAGLGAGWQAGRHQNGWELPGILHDPCHEAYTTCPDRWGRAASPVGVPAARGRGYVWFRGVAPVVRDSVPVRSQPPPP